MSVLVVSTAPPGASEEAVRALVLIDFGDGSALWADVTLTTNRTAVRATELAGSQLALNVDVTWYSIGAFVSDIGDQDPGPDEFFALYVWENDDWSYSDTGALDLNLGEGDAIAWVLTGWDSTFWPIREPEATPDQRHPVVAFRGDLANTGRHVSSFAGPPHVAWSFDTTAFEISATPATSRGRVFVATWEGTYALDRQSGSLLWARQDVAGMSTPAIHNGNLVLGARDGKLHYLDGRDGSERWNVTLIAPEYVAFTGVASSPKVAAGTAYIGAFNESGGEGGVYAVSMIDGSIVWRYPASSVHQSSPAIQDGALYIGVAGHYNATSLGFDPPHGLLSLWAANGSLRWFAETESAVLSSPAYIDGTVVFTSREGTLHLLDAGNGSVRWRRAIGVSTSSPAVSHGMIYVGAGSFAGGGTVYAFDTVGRELWQTEVHGGVQSSVAVADDRLFVTTNEASGTLVCLKADTGEVLWSHTPQPEEYILASPILSDGMLFVASDNGLVYAYEAEPAAAVPTEWVLAFFGGLVAAFLIAVMWRRSRA